MFFNDGKSFIQSHEFDYADEKSLDSSNTSFHDVC